MTGDVADGERDGAVRSIHDVVPVPADVDPACRREVAPVGLDVDRVRGALGHQVALQGHGGLVLDLVRPGTLERHARLVRERADQLGVLGRRRRSLLSEVHDQGADRLALGNDRDGVEAPAEGVLGREAVLEPCLPHVRRRDPHRATVPIDVREHGAIAHADHDRGLQTERSTRDHPGDHAERLPVVARERDRRRVGSDTAGGAAQDRPRGVLGRDRPREPGRHLLQAGRPSQRSLFGLEEPRELERLARLLGEGLDEPQLVR